MKLELANCCGSCEFSNKPKKPQDHAAHYEVAKTERYCFLYHVPTMREAYCDSYKFNKKTAAYRAYCRVAKQLERQELILQIAAMMIEKEITCYKSKDLHYDYKIVNNILYFSYREDSPAYPVSCKDGNYHADDLKVLYECILSTQALKDMDKLELFKEE
jgi:hypothetical protein